MLVSSRSLLAALIFALVVGLAFFPVPVARSAASPSLEAGTLPRLSRNPRPTFRVFDPGFVSRRELQVVRARQKSSFMKNDTRLLKHNRTFRCCRAGIKYSYITESIEFVKKITITLFCSL
jgi:hypothetical protein